MRGTIAPSEKSSGRDPITSPEGGSIEVPDGRRSEGPGQEHHRSIQRSTSAPGRQGTVGTDPEVRPLGRGQHSHGGLGLAP